MFMPLSLLWLESWPIPRKPLELTVVGGFSVVLTSSGRILLQHHHHSSLPTTLHISQVILFSSFSTLAAFLLK